MVHTLLAETGSTLTKLLGGAWSTRVIEQIKGASSGNSIASLLDITF
jgi:hypothetical protein